MRLQPLLSMTVWLLAVISVRALIVQDEAYDVVVYDASSGGVVAAVASARHGAKTLLICASWPACFHSGGRRVGGMSSGGLGQTDFGGCSERIGGIANEFYSRNRQHYGHLVDTTNPETNNQATATLTAKSECRLPAPDCNQTFNLEPHVAQSIFMAMLEEAGVDIMFGAQVVDASFSGNSSATGAEIITSIVLAVEEEAAAQNSTIRRIPNNEKSNLATASLPLHAVTTNLTIHGKVFIDASYEGDLLARAGASFVTGREANTTYGESLNGRSLQNNGNQMSSVIDPYWDDGTTLPFIFNGSVAEPGQADNTVQAYNYRLCVTTNTSNMLPFPRPTDYNPNDWEILRRMHKRGLLDIHGGAPSCNCGRLPNNKFDMNNCGGFSTDFLMGSWSYPNASYSERQTIWSAHRDYLQGLLWTMSTELNITQGWGLCKDEFIETGGFPPALYVRAARRLLGDKVFTQNTPKLQGDIGKNSIGIACYNFDAHNAQRFPCKNQGACYGFGPPGVGNNTPYVWNEGDVEVGPGTYQIPYYVMLPKESELTNLLVVAAPSASHIGMSSLRMEPQFMIVGHSAGVAASMVAAAAPGTYIHDLDMDSLHAKLKADGQKLDVGIRPVPPDGGSYSAVQQ